MRTDHCHFQQGGTMSVMTMATIFVIALTACGVIYAVYGK